MKKVLLLILFLTLLCGCTKKEKINCVYENEKENNKFSAKMVINLEDEKVVDIKGYIHYDDKKAAESMCKIYKMTSGEDDVECNNKDITLKNVHSGLKKDNLTRSGILRYYREQNYTCE